MPQKSGSLREWLNLLEQMKRCASVAELTMQHGSPHHKEQHESMEIWHYPLGIAGGVLYSIHVAVTPDQSMQVYMHMVPTRDAPAPVPKRPWWKFW
jgi:uncharacterized lipoprotein YbaY